MSGNLMKLLTACVAKSTTANPLSLPFWAYILSLEPSAFADIAIGEGDGLIENVHAISLVCVSITFPRFVGGLAPLLPPATTYLPSGEMYKSWMPPLIAMVLTFVSEEVSITSTPPLGAALISG